MSRSEIGAAPPIACATSVRQGAIDRRGIVVRPMPALPHAVDPAVQGSEHRQHRQTVRIVGGRSRLQRGGDLAEHRGEACRWRLFEPTLDPRAREQVGVFGGIGPGMRMLEQIAQAAQHRDRVAVILRMRRRLQAVLEAPQMRGKAADADHLDVGEAQALPIAPVGGATQILLERRHRQHAPARHHDRRHREGELDDQGADRIGVLTEMKRLGLRRRRSHVDPLPLAVAQIGIGDGVESGDGVRRRRPAPAGRRCPGSG